MLQGCLTVIGGGVVLLVIVAIVVSGGNGDEQAAGPTAIPSRAPTALTSQTEQSDVQAESPETNADPQPQPAATASSARQETDGSDAETEQFAPIQTGEGRTVQDVAYSVVQDPIDDALTTFVGVIDSEADQFAFDRRRSSSGALRVSSRCWYQECRSRCSRMSWMSNIALMMRQPLPTSG